LCCFVGVSSLNLGRASGRGPFFLRRWRSLSQDAFRSIGEVVSDSRQVQKFVPATPVEDVAPEIPWGSGVRRAYEYWLGQRPGGGLPGRQHIDPTDIPFLLRGLWLIDVAREPFRFRYRLVGTRIVEAMGRDPTGLWLEEAHPHASSVPGFFLRYERVAQTGIPSRRRGTALLWSHRDYREIENILLPLAADGKTVDMIMVYTSVYRVDGSEVD